MAAPVLPGSGFYSNLTSPAPSGQGVAGYVAALDATVTFIKTMIGAAFESSISLASDTFAPSKSSYVVSAESGTSDNLAQLGVTNAYDGMEVRVRPAPGHMITVKNNTGSVGKLLTADGADFVMSDATQRAWFVY